MTRNRTVAQVGYAVVVSGSTAAALHEHLVRTTDPARVRPDVAYLLEALGDVRRAWERGVLSASGHADTAEGGVPAGSGHFEDGVTTVEAGRLLGCSPRSAQRLATSGRVASRRVGQSLLLSRGDVLAVLEEQRDAEAG